MQTLFIADLHLSDHEPELTRLLCRFLHEHAETAAELYILGDLFEAWTGDDDPSRTAAQVAEALAAFARHAPVYFMAGNRDFLLGNAYAARAGMQILPEPCVIERHGRRILLTHGDEMCTDDMDYQKYRAVIRRPWVCRLLLSLPFALRRRIAEKMRNASRQRQKSADVYAIADVTEAGVQAAFANHAPFDAIVHGHTHRPNTHQHQCGHRTVTRYVLPDWKHGEGGYLSLDADGFCFHALPESANPTSETES